MSNSIETLVEYYDAISNADLEKICEYFYIDISKILLHIIWIYIKINKNMMIKYDFD